MSSGYDGGITSTCGIGGVHRAGPGEPGPVRGDPRLVRRSTDYQQAATRFGYPRWAMIELS